MHTRPLTAHDFDWIHWKEGSMKAAAGEAIDRFNHAKTAIIAVLEKEKTFENTVWPFESAIRELDGVESRLHVLAHMSTEKAVRDSAHAATEWIAHELVDVLYDPAFAECFFTLAARKLKSQAEEKRLLERIVNDFKRMGLELPKKQREKIKKLSKLITKHSLAFSQNVNEYKDELAVTLEELNGLSEDYIKRLKRDGQGHYLVSMSYPEAKPYLKNATNDKKRAEFRYKFDRRGGKKNITLMRTVVSLKEKHAKLLGYKNHAQYVLENRMAKTPERVALFVSDIIEALKGPYKRELDELTAYKRTVTGDSKTTIQLHDIEYYTDKLLKETAAFDAEQVREYLPVDYCVAQMFEIFSDLFGVHYRKRDDVTMWATGVDLYEVTNKDGSIQGYVIFDLYPREGKYGHAAVFDIDDGYVMYLHGEERMPNVKGLVCNFPAPQEGQPSFISHSELQTLFHEFGHLMHFTLNTATFASIAGSKVARDFVEVPSQMLENWVWDKKFLKRLSKHRITGEPLPNACIEKIITNRTFHIASWSMRQLMYGRFDQMIHTKTPTTDTELIVLYENIHKRVLGVSMTKDTFFPASFTHLVGGYDAGYYGYMWALVYAADLFTTFEGKGITNKKVGAEYRALLAKGATEDELSLVKKFLGRSPNNKAFLKQLGVGKKK